MTRGWKQTGFAVIVSVSLLASGVPVWAEEAPEAAAADVSGGSATGSEEAAVGSVLGTYYGLTETLQAAVKSVLSEKTSAGARIGAVVYLKNTGTTIVRVPEYEVRVKTVQGVEYTLRAGAGSPTAVEPQSQVELSYMLTIDRAEEAELKELSWVDVDYYTYPKTETPKLAVDVSGAVWTGGSTAVQDEAAIRKWGDPFRLVSENSPIVFTPTEIQKTLDTYTVTVLAENPGAYKESVPAFTLQGRGGGKTYTGVRSQAGELQLEPGEKRYIHYSIPTEAGTKLTSLDVLTPETYMRTTAQGQTEAVSYTVGRYNVLLPSGGVDNRYVPEYEYNTPIAIDPLSDLYNPNVDVSLVEFNIHDGLGSGYKTAVAKLVLTNRSAEAVAIPPLGSDLATTDGYTYNGTAVSTPSQLLPGLSHVVSFSYVLPDTEAGDNLRMKLLEVKNPETSPGVGAGYRSPVATLQVDSQLPGGLRDELTFYPFGVKVNWWLLQEQYLAQTSSYTYKLKMDLEVTQTEKVVVDQDFSKLELALVDSRERIIAQEQLSFVSDNNGLGKLTSGEVTATFANLRREQFESDMRVYLYETINTPTGPARRLVAKLEK